MPSGIVVSEQNKQTATTKPQITTTTNKSPPKPQNPKMKNILKGLWPIQDGIKIC